MQRHILPWTIIVLVPVFGAQYAEQLVIVLWSFMAITVSEKGGYKSF